MRNACITTLLAFWIAACASLPSQEGRRESFALAETGNTRLGSAIMPLVRAHGGSAGIHPLPAPRDAFAARAVLAAAADKSIDAQYYIWHGDETGYLLFEALWRAAERGVRVRILLDDANTKELGETLAALDAHPNIEVRLYNPFVYRNARALDFVGDFARVNRRMHNKSFTADNQATIVGGRNIGNEYFAAGDDATFRDLDVIGIGPVVADVSREFDLYWNSASAYPAGGLVGAAPPDAVARLEARFADNRADPRASAYRDAVRTTPLLRDLAAGRLDIEWTQARVVRDDPAKTLDTQERSDVLLLTELMRIIGPPQQSFDLVSPYFVPGEAGTAALTGLVERGVRVRVLTNSLAATDVTPVHAGYARRRCDLARAGVHLYELKRESAEPREKPDAKTASEAYTSLHAKTFAIDGIRIFVGSFNFDPRSARLNTEMGVVIDSPRLAQRLAATLDADLPSTTYEVVPQPGDDCVAWIERTPRGEIRHTVEPATDALKRSWVKFLQALPIEWLL